MELACTLTTALTTRNFYSTVDKGNHMLKSAVRLIFSHLSVNFAVDNEVDRKV